MALHISSSPSSSSSIPVTAVLCVPGHSSPVAITSSPTSIALPPSAVFAKIVFFFFSIQVMTEIQCIQTNLLFHISVLIKLAHFFFIGFMRFFLRGINIAFRSSCRAVGNAAKNKA